MADISFEEAQLLSSCVRMSVVSKSSLWSSDCDVVLPFIQVFDDGNIFTMWYHTLWHVLYLVWEIANLWKDKKSINGFFFIEIQYKYGYWKYANKSEYYNIIKIISKSNIFSEKPFLCIHSFFVNPKGNSDRISSIVNEMCVVFRFCSVLDFLQCLPIQSKKEGKQGMNKK